MSEFLASLRLYLEGRKTHIVAVAFAIFNILVQENYIHLSGRHIDLINAILAALGLSMLRLAVNKV